ncbi:MAG: hypothetical protein HC945_00450 [Nitrosarchaeum sp.]|nr:hypothetical protein [Nitrosarchaeum sp.]
MRWWLPVVLGLVLLAPVLALDGSDFDYIVLPSQGSALEALAAVELAKVTRVVEEQVQDVAYSGDVAVEGFLLSRPNDMLEGSELLQDVVEVVTEDEFPLLARGFLQTGEALQGMSSICSCLRAAPRRSRLLMMFLMILWRSRTIT